MLIDSLKQSPIFIGIEDEDLGRLINCLNPTVQSYSKNELVFAAGERETRVGIILSGEARIFSEDYFGNSEAVATLGKDELFGDILAGVEQGEIIVRAVGGAQIMFIEYRKLTGICETACAYHIHVLANLLRLFAEKNRELNRKLQILQKRGTREKLLAYLCVYAKKANSSKFSIPLNRAELAEYLRVDRSAMSRELCAMRDEGILEFYKNSFILFAQE